jgi:hypothetical protein
MWDQTGRNLQTITRVAPWFPAWTGTDATNDRASRPLPRIRTVTEFGGKYLAVVMTVAARDWKPSVVGRSSADGVVPASGPAIYEKEIEVIDLTSNQVIVRQRTSTWLTGVVVPGLLYSADTGPDGLIFIDLWQLQLRQSP